ncbi:hypothetical protein D3C78_1622940 [compost metagenome]
MSVTTPSAIANETPVIPFCVKEFSIVVFSTSSGLIVTVGSGAGAGFTVVLLTTDLTPLIPFTEASRAVLLLSSFTSPIRVTTPFSTVALTLGP